MSLQKQVVKCFKCKDTGIITMNKFERCAVCDGTGGTVCVVCHGLGVKFENSVTSYDSTRFTSCVVKPCDKCIHGFINRCYECHGIKSKITGTVTKSCDCKK